MDTVIRHRTGLLMLNRGGAWHELAKTWLISNIWRTPNEAMISVIQPFLLKCHCCVILYTHGLQVRDPPLLSFDNTYVWQPMAFVPVCMCACDWLPVCSLSTLDYVWVSASACLAAWVPVNRVYLICLGLLPASWDSPSSVLVSHS